MKIFVDENIPLITVKQLRSKGFDVTDIRGTPDQGMPDEHLWERALQEKRLLITTDKGFSNYRYKDHYGLLIIRLKQPTRLKIHQYVMQAIEKYSEKDWRGMLVVMRDSVQSSWRFGKNK
jgi:predicted nuclease of predicted toxin-antitoxin system